MFCLARVIVIGTRDYLKYSIPVELSSGCVSVDIFKLEYLRNQWANRNEFLSEPSFGWGKGGKAALGFGPDRIGTLVSMATDSSHRVIMGEMFSAL